VLGRTTTDNTVLEVFDALAEPLSEMGQHYLSEIVRLTGSIPDELLGVNYPAVVDRLLYLIAKAEGKYAGGYDQPIELTQLMLALAAVPKDGSVYNPFAGLASIGALLRSDAQYYGQEINARTWALGMIRLRAHRPLSRNFLYNENSVRDWNLPDERFNLVVANPPFNLRIDDTRKYQTFRQTTAEGFFLERGYSDANEKGKVICVVALGFLSINSGERRRFRDWILGSGTLDTVISLPGGLLSYTSMPMALIMLDKGRDRNAPVRMVDASRFVLPLSRTDRRLDLEALMIALNAGEEPGVVRYVDQSEIHANDLNLMPKRYVMEPAAVVEGSVRLGDHVTTLSLERLEPGALMPLVRIRDLKEDPIEARLKVDGLEVQGVPSLVRKLDRSALLLATRWNNLKPTWFEYTGTPVAVTNDIMIVDVDQATIDVDYLTHELLSDSVKMQLDRLNLGMTIPSLRREDVLRILIELPSKAEQLAKVRGLREAQVAAQVAIAKRTAKQHGVHLEGLANVASLEHRLGRPLLNLGAGVNLLNRGLDGLGPHWRSQIVGAKEQAISLGEIMEGMMRELQRVSDLIESNDVEIDPVKYPLAVLDLAAYAEKTARRTQVNLNGGHKVTFAVDPDIRTQLFSKAEIMGHEKLLDDAVNAIVDNAVRHAFHGETPPHFLEFWIGFRLVDEQPWLELSISNSGKPFPRGIGRAQYITKHSYAGERGHTGLGGFDVHRIMEIHGGRVELDTDPLLSGGRYSTCITLAFPMNKELIEQ
jgi:type I restriction enzyme M protein